jgi:2-(1,2-epoxy-1,2-dihydrophenyl)acetyl-CoA isomerase
LALCGDLILCTKSAKFSAPFLRLGLVADMGLSYLASRRIGTEKTKRLLLTGEMINAETAEQWGLVDWVVEEENLLESRAFEVAKNLADSSSLAIGIMKSMINHVHQSYFTAILNQELANQNLLFLSRDYHVGVQAFLEKRKPLFHKEN